jgi:hypothetical protein
MEVFMDLVTLRKKLSTYESDKGYLKNVSDDLLFEVLKAWEQWTGPGKDFYRSLGFSSSQMASVIGKAKKLKREGYFGEEGFKEVKVEAPMAASFGDGPCSGIELAWNNGNIIRFSQVELLVDFLKKVA